MNVFDFDKTIYPRDSTAEFIVYIAIRHPLVVIDLMAGLPKVMAYKRGKITKTEMKEKLFRCFGRVKDIDRAVKCFWDKRESRVAKWYRDIKRSDDVVISASPEFLLSDICSRLGVACLMASRVDKKTGAYTGENCYGEEKPNRFRERFSEDEIEAFYSDSRSDDPMARLAQRAYIVKGEELHPW